MIHQPAKSKRVQTMALALALWLFSAVVAPPVWACCDNVFSCAAAVVTAGATCLIDEAANALRGLIQQVENVREIKRRGFTAELEKSLAEAESESEKYRRIAQEAELAIKGYLEEANRITGDDTLWITNSLKYAAVQPLPNPIGGLPAAVPKNNVSAFKQLPAPGTALDPKPSIGIGTLTQRPSPGSTIGTDAVTVDKAPALNKIALQQLLADPSLETLKRQIEVERQRLQAARKRLIEAKTRAAEAMANSTQAASTVFHNSFLGRVDQLLAALQAVLRNPLNAGQLITGALGILDGAISAFDRDVVPAVERDAQVKQTEVANVKREADQAQRHAETAKRILVKMREGVQLKTVVERRALVSAARAAAPVSAAKISANVSLKSSNRLLAMSKTLRTDMVTVRPELQRLASHMQRPDLAPIQTRLTTSFDQYFKGKSPAEVETTRHQLILEARQRYSADRNLLTSIEQLINDEARTRSIRVGTGIDNSQCHAGFVERLANASDRVCVTPESHKRALQENATAASRRNPNGGPYGPNTCLTGFVWREAFAGDAVCVTPEVRQLVRQENALSVTRSLETPGPTLIRPRGIEEKTPDEEKKP
ncbi:MAG: hypothetical protein OEW33_02595 [Nitrospirota bacterium]|nr:hypothetical protein [Nitrospirota bacterium]MDH4359609.1 hypothetical protein [Nitrospirota bacterium]